MAKFLKTIFQPSEKKSQYEENPEEDRADTPPMGGRRQLSISRSGRMRQANKKRHSLVLDLYGDNDNIQEMERPKTMEYHVHTVTHTAPAEMEVTPRRYSSDNTGLEGATNQTIEIGESQTSTDPKLRKLMAEKSPEEEIDNAFEIIDKS